MDFFLRTKKDQNNEFHQGKPDLFWGQGENDLMVDAGDFALISGVENLNQSVAKILVTERGNNIFFTEYGSLLQSFIGQNFDVDYLRAKIKTDVIDTLRIYQFINKDNSNLDEQIELLRSLKISQIFVGGLEVSFQLLTRSGKTAGGLVQVEG